MKKGLFKKLRSWHRRQPSLSIADNFPLIIESPKNLLPRLLYPLLNSQKGEVVITAISGFLGSTLLSFGGGGGTAMTGVTAAGSTYAVAGAATTITVGQALSVALTVGSTILSMSTSKQKSPTSLRGGTLVNGHVVGDPVRIPYGRIKTGGTWGWWRTTSSNVLALNDLLHVVIGWGEGIQELDTDIEQPFFTGGGLSDLKSGGYYTGADHHKFKVKIDGTGTPDTVSIYDDGGTTPIATGVPITGNWQNISNGVKFKFPVTTGHTNGNYWVFYAGKGLWIGERLSYYLAELSPKVFVEHYFHSGSFTQVVDPSLQSYIPEYDNPHRGTCYSYIRLRFAFTTETTVWEGIPDFRTVLKKIDILDTRTSVVGYTNNAALIYYNFLTNGRYGRGRPTTKVLTSDINAAANWCDPDKVTRGGSTYTCIGDHTSGALTEPGVGADWQTYWELTGTGGSPWVISTYYRMGFTFNGVILDRQEGNDVLKEMRLNFCAFHFESEGKHRLKTWDDDASVMPFSQMENEIEISPESFSIEEPGIQESPDIVKCVFINPDKNWGSDTQQYPDDGDVTGYPPDGNPTIFQIELIGCTSARLAKQIAKFQYNRLRRSKRFPLLAHPKLTALEPGDMIACTHEFPGWSAKKVRVDNFGFIQEGLVPLIVIDENPDIYDLEVKITDEGTSSYSKTEVPALEAPTGCTETTGADEDTPSIVDAYLTFQWDWMGDGVSYELQYKKTAVSDWTAVPTTDPGYSITPPTTVKYRTGELGCNVSYDWRVKSLKVGGQFSEWSAVRTKITWKPTIPSITGVILTATGRLNKVVLKWTNPTAGSNNVKQWKIYRNITNATPDPALDTDFLTTKANYSRSHVDDDGIVYGINYYYFIFIEDKWGQYSASATASTAGISGEDTTPPTDPSNVVLALTRARDDSKWYSEATVSFTGSMDTNLIGYYIQIWNTTDNVKVGTRHIQLTPSTAVPPDDRATTVIAEIKGIFWVKKLASPYTTITYVAKVMAYDKSGNLSNEISSSGTTNPGSAPAAPQWAIVNPCKANNLTITLTIQRNTEKDLGGYEYYISTSPIPDPPTGLTPVKTANSTICTWTAPAKGTYHCRVRAFDTEDINGVPNYSALSTVEQDIAVSVGLTKDTTAPYPPGGAPGDPPTNPANTTPVAYLDSVIFTKYKTTLSCDVGTDTDSPPVMYEFRYWRDGEDGNHATPHSTSSPAMTVYGWDKNVTYHWNVKYYDAQKNYGSPTATQTIVIGAPSTKPADPTIVGASILGGIARFQWNKNTETQMTGGHYYLYINTSNNSGTSKVLKKVPHPLMMTATWIGEKTEDLALTIAVEIPYWFWLTAVDHDGIESLNKIAFNSGASLTLLRPVWFNGSSQLVNNLGTQINPDHLGDGSTYGRPLLTRLNAGKPLIDFAEAIHLNKIIDNIPNGATYGKTTFNEVTGALRAYSALNSSSRLTTGMESGATIINTPAQISVPSAFYFDLRAHNNDADTRHYTADFLTLHNTANTETFALTNVSETADGSGAAGWRYFYVEYKVSTTDIQLICSATAPNAHTPSTGYNYWVYVGSCWWTGAAFRNVYQFNDYIWGPPGLAKNNEHAAVADVPEAVDLSGYIPPTAKMWMGYMGRSAPGVQAGMGISSEASGGVEYEITLPAAAALIYGLLNPLFFTLPLPSTQTCYWRTDTNTAHVHAIAVTAYIEDN